MQIHRFNEKVKEIDLAPGRQHPQWRRQEMRRENHNIYFLFFLSSSARDFFRRLISETVLICLCEFYRVLGETDEKLMYYMFFFGNFRNFYS